MATGFALVFGFTGLLLLSGYIKVVDRFVSTQTIYLNMVGHIGILKSGSVEDAYRNPEKYLLSSEEQKEIEQVLEIPFLKENIEKVSKKLTAFALLSAAEKNLPIYIEAYSEGMTAYIENHPQLVKWLPTLLSKIKSSDGVSLTKELYSMLGHDVNAQPIDVQVMTKTLDGYLNGVSDKLTGVHTTGLAFAEDVSAKMSLPKLQELLATDKIGTFSIFLKDETKIEEVIKQLKLSLKGKGFEIYSYNSDEIGAYYTGTMSFINSIGFFFYSLIALVSIFSIVNTLTMGINERTKEIGTLRSMGFNNYQISNLFSLEVIMLTFFAIIISSILYYVLSSFINSLKIPFEPAGSSGYVYFTIYISNSIMLAHACIILFISYLTSFIACKKKLNFNIAELLNEQGVYK
ncbi:MAG: FtsX-like permease family protein [Bdellovibrionaceae bacterium]|nr:FtsX-like permease family protein [Pseudobdellovibrionaceae bacterium]NUM59197.1 ABC transporter permease [Pseudobdellovibrionaceae bacterium]